MFKGRLTCLLHIFIHINGRKQPVRRIHYRPITLSTYAPVTHIRYFYKNTDINRLRIVFCIPVRISCQPGNFLHRIMKFSFKFFLISIIGICQIQSLPHCLRILQSEFDAGNLIFSLRRLGHFLFCFLLCLVFGLILYGVTPAQTAR